MLEVGDDDERKEEEEAEGGTASGLAKRSSLGLFLDRWAKSAGISSCGSLASGLVDLLCHRPGRLLDRSLFCYLVLWGFSMPMPRGRK